jgi:hypothetical protein
LRDHLARAQIARQPHQPGGAEGAAHRAADLAGDADRRAVRIEHEHRFQQLAVAGAVEDAGMLVISA